MAPTEPQPNLHLARRTRPRRSPPSQQQRVSLCEILDRVLNKGVVIAGDVVISVAGVDLVYLGINAVVTSVETMRGWDSGKPMAPPEGERP